MCRIVYGTNKVDRELLIKLFNDLEKSAGGDGNGIGGFVDGVPFISKSVKTSVEESVGALMNIEWDNGFLFHTRRASVGLINNENCHPFLWGNTVTIHNGHIDGFGVLKLMMLENLEKYQVDGWTQEKIMVTSDSDILSYFIWKKGFDIVPMMDCGTVITMYPNEVRMYVGHCLEAIQVGAEWIYASEFSDKIGLASEQWLVFGKGTDITIHPDSSCILNTGWYVDGKELWNEKQKKRKGRNKSNVIEVV
jgi:hypothetical protein